MLSPQNSKLSQSSNSLSTSFEKIYIVHVCKAKYKHLETTIGIVLTPYNVGFDEVWIKVLQNKLQWYNQRTVVFRRLEYLLL